MAFRRRLLGLSATVAGGLRRSLTTATSHPPWAVMRFSSELVGAPSVDVRLAEPPHVSELCFPEHLVKTRGSPDPTSGVLQNIAGGIRAVSGDGHLLLSYVDLRYTAPIVGNKQEPTGFDPSHVPSVTRFVCNPVGVVSSQLFRARRRWLDAGASGGAQQDLGPQHVDTLAVEGDDEHRAH